MSLRFMVLVRLISLLGDLAVADPNYHLYTSVSFKAQNRWIIFDRYYALYFINQNVISTISCCTAT